ncbi:hypothetical protein ALC53_03139 [Atta colombica]|uniref:Uncharacterized protein n=1 Tax=Atta colombica TaxID=520822 RepID=A0A195BRS5_9HYME|nr:hypothetical protein ALC53_03139 [Atta colombica]
MAKWKEDESESNESLELIERMISYMNLLFAENRSHLFAISYFEIYSSFLSMSKKSAERWDIYGCCKRFAKSFENSHHFVESSSRFHMVWREAGRDRGKIERNQERKESGLNQEGSEEEV